MQLPYNVIQPCVPLPIHDPSRLSLGLWSSHIPFYSSPLWPLNLGHKFQIMMHHILSVSAINSSLIPEYKI